jgi:hypothetical protein
LERRHGVVADVLEIAAKVSAQGRKVSTAAELAQILQKGKLALYVVKLGPHVDAESVADVRMGGAALRVDGGVYDANRIKRQMLATVDTMGEFSEEVYCSARSADYGNGVDHDDLLTVKSPAQGWSRSAANSPTSWLQPDGR